MEQSYNTGRPWVLDLQECYFLTFSFHIFLQWEIILLKCKGSSNQPTNNHQYVSLLLCLTPRTQKSVLVSLQRLSVLVNSSFLSLLMVDRVSIFQRKDSKIPQFGGLGQLCLGFIISLTARKSNS